MDEHDRRRPRRELQVKGTVHLPERIEPWEVETLAKAFAKPRVAPAETSETHDVE